MADKWDSRKFYDKHWHCHMQFAQSPVFTKRSNSRHWKLNTNHRAWVLGNEQARWVHTCSMLSQWGGGIGLELECRRVSTIRHTTRRPARCTPTDIFSASLRVSRIMPASSTVTRASPSLSSCAIVRCTPLSASVSMCTANPQESRNTNTPASVWSSHT